MRVGRWVPDRAYVFYDGVRSLTGEGYLQTRSCTGRCVGGPPKQVGADAWNPEAGILGLNIGKDNLKNIEQILTNQKYY